MIGRAGLPRQSNFQKTFPRCGKGDIKLEKTNIYLSTPRGRPIDGLKFYGQTATLEISAEIEFSDVVVGRLCS